MRSASSGLVLIGFCDANWHGILALLGRQKRAGEGQKREKWGSTTLRVPESSLTSVLTKPVVA